MRLINALILAAALVFPALGADRTFSSGEVVSIQPDQGYVLVRTFQRRGSYISGNFGYTPVLIRVLSGEEIRRVKTEAESDPENWTKRIEPNVAVPIALPYSDSRGEQLLLMSLKPGTYILGGLARTSWGNSDGWSETVASLCIGTVSFKVTPGVLTDLGTILNARDDEPTNIPELSKVVMGKSIGFQMLVEDVAVRPASAGTELPEALRALPLVPADYRAVAPFPNYLQAAPGRLAPLAGVLDYDKDGHVMDLKAQSAKQQ